MFRTTLGADERTQLESQLAVRLAPLREVTPSEGAMAAARGALLSATAASPAPGEAGGLRSWQRGAVIGVAIAAPLAAGGAFAAIPSENLAAVPQFAAQSFVSAISSSGSPASSDVGVLEDESTEGESGSGEEPESNISSMESSSTTQSLEDPNGGEPSGDTPLVNGELDAGATESVTESFVPPGHEICFEANSTARARLAELLEREDLEEDQRAELEASLADLENCGLGLDEEGEEEAPVEETPTEEPVDEGNGHAACFAATENARGVLTRLLEKLPPQGAAGVAKALAAIESCGLGNEETDDGETENGSETMNEEPSATATETTRGGPPPHAGPPAGVGPNAEGRQAGPPENAGPPEHAGPPAGVGPNRDSQPGEPAPTGEAAPVEDERRGGPPPHAGPPEGFGPNNGGSDGADTSSEESQPGSGSGRPSNAGPPAGVGPGSGGGGNPGGGPPAGVGRNR